MLAGLNRSLDRLRHRDLAGPFGPADPGHGHREQAGDIGGMLGRHRRR